MEATLGRLCLRYLFSHKRLFFLAFTCGCVYGLTSGLGLPLIFEKVFRKIFEDPQIYSWATIVGIALLIPSGFFIRGLFGYLSTFWMNRCGLEILTALRADIFQKLQYLPLSFFEKKTAGDLIHRVVTDPKTLQEVLLEIASESIKQPLQMIAAFISLIYLSIKHCDLVLLSIFLVAIPICFLPVRLLRSRVKNNSRIMQQTEAEVTTCVAENLQASQEIRTFNLEQTALQKIKAIMQRLADRIQGVVRWQKMQQPLMEIVSSSLIGVIFIYAYLRQVPFSVFSAMGTALYFAFDPIKKITNLMGMIQRSTGAFERIIDIIDMPVALKSPQKNAYKGESDGSFQLNQVSFAYGGEDCVLKDVSLEIEAKKFYALVGPSGAGKSTLLKLLPRLYDATQGTISFGQVPLPQWDLTVLRQQIAVVPQSPVLFNGTLLENLRIGNPQATLEEVIQAAKMAYAHEFILEAGGYDAPIGENGNRFSGGQRQRLALARAFIKNAPVLLLDEATSALDSESEYFIKKTMENLAKTKTVIAIAHRISTIQNADHILLFDKGQLVSQGTHTQLFQTNTLYHHLVEKQLLQA